MCAFNCGIFASLECGICPDVKQRENLGQSVISACLFREYADGKQTGELKQ
jgi:hypothetical protein